MTIRLALAFILTTFAAAAAQQPGAADAKPAGPIKTRWAKDVNPDAPLPEYPRPQMVRERWLNLNGRWQWAPAVEGEEPPLGRDLAGTIVVPFPIESALSGVGEHFGRFWYRRTFEVPAGWSGERLLLHFGAADWEATVYVNGRKVGVHRGGYDPFTFDITAAIKPGGPQELIVGIYDPTDSGDQPRGKQTRNPQGIWYTPCTGLWQTVWLEPVPAVRIEGLNITADWGVGAVWVEPRFAGAARGLEARIVARAEGKEVGTAFSIGEPVVLGVKNRRSWSPEDPFLYDLTVELYRNGKPVDTVTSYFGLREVRRGKDEKGVQRIFLNGEPYFQVGPLDQGYWPDGIYTAPTDEALRFDIQESKRLGFNMIRKHVKVEPQRWYYWADRLGVLVWQDMPSPLPPRSGYTEEGKRQFERELGAMIAARRNHPSIIMWVVFNEGWGQFETPRMTELAEQLDPFRLVNNASGWTDAKVGDVIDIHNYPEPKAPPTEPLRAAVLGEFGGLGLAVPGHMWKADHWGYKAMATPEALTRKYEEFLRKTYELRDSAGLAAAVYTQTTDVEIETNGLLTYDREVLKVDAERVAAVNRGDFSLVPPPPVVTTLVPTSQGEAQTWRFTTTTPGADWMLPDFDAQAWKSAPGGFGTKGTPGATVGTVWDGAEIWLRREFALQEVPKAPHLRIHHDEDCEVYINGVLAAKLPGYTTEYEDVPLSAAAAAALRAGGNLLAVRCVQTRGGQYIDVGLVNVAAP